MFDPATVFGIGLPLFAPARSRIGRSGTSVADADLDRLCLDNIARFKRPKRYVYVDSLPKNNYGKVLKTELRELAKKA